jgi:glycosyltransferase involved in cell wall biosynthesis
MKISLIASLYKTDSHIKKWKKWLISFADEMKQKSVSFEIIIVANEPTELEKKIFGELRDGNFEWLRITEVPRESIFASWNRGIKESTGEVIGFINVDDIRLADSLIDGMQRISEGADFVYFPFIYKRYVKILNFNILAKVKKFYPPTPEEARKIMGMPYGPFWLISRKFSDIAGNFDESFKVAGDFEWSMRTQNEGRYELSDVMSGIFTSNGTTLSGSRSTIQAEEIERIHAMHGDKTAEADASRKQ